MYQVTNYKKKSGYNQGWINKSLKWTIHDLLVKNTP